MRNKISQAAICAALGFLTFMPSAGAAEKWSYYAVFPSGGWPGSRVAETFDKIKERTNGELEIQYVGFNETPYKADAALQLIKDDLVEMTEMAAVYISATHPVFSIPGLPFLPKEYMETTEFTAFSDEVWSNEAMRSQLVTIFDSYNATDIGSLYSTPASMFFNGPLGSLDDVKSRRIRVYDASGATLVSELGGSPVSMTGGEVYSALQRGGLDGYIAGTAGVLPFHWDEFTKTAYIANLSQSRDFLMVSKSKLAGLDENTRNILLEEMTNLSKQLRDEIGGNQEDVLKALVEKGIDVKRPSKEEYETLHTLAKEKIWPSWTEKNTGPEKEAFDGIMKMVE